MCDPNHSSSHAICAIAPQSCRVSTVFRRPRLSPDSRDDRYAAGPRGHACAMTNALTNALTRALLADLHQRGDVMRVLDLSRLGHSRTTTSAALGTGSIVRICNGWVAAPEADRDAVVAIVNRGKLTSASALASRGLWDGCDSRIHVAVPPNSPRSAKVSRSALTQFRPPPFPRSGLVRHWVPERAPDDREPPWRQSITDTLWVASKHLPADQFVACLDSALHEGVLSRAGLPRLESLLPARSRGLLRLVDPRAESGLETLTRIRLSRWVRDIQPQFAIPGIAQSGGTGRVDLLLNGWLAIELDGDQWHDPKRDRARDAELVRRGFRAHRFGFDQVVLDWPNTEAAVAELLAYPPPNKH